VVGFNPSEKCDFISWDDDIPNIWENNPNVPNHQPDYNLSDTNHYHRYYRLPSTTCQYPSIIILPVFAKG